MSGSASEPPERSAARTRRAHVQSVRPDVGKRDVLRRQVRREELVAHSAQPYTPTAAGAGVRC